VPRDSVEEKQKKTLNDSLDARLLRLEAKKDSVIKKLDGYQQKLNSLLEKKQQAEAMMQQLNQLKATAEQIQQLTEKKNYLEGVQKNLERFLQANMGDISRLNDPTVLKQNLLEQGMFTGLINCFLV
jgi:seryl-tRNA synthetase